MSTMLEWAKQELDLAGYPEDSDEEMDVWMRNDVLKLLEVFTEQGHSGMSAPFAIAMFNRLASWKPLTPLTGADDEWNEVGDDTWQNRRDSEVFKKADGQAYWMNGIVWYRWVKDNPEDINAEPYQSYFTNRESRVNITFPWTRPEKPEYREWKED
jgi:hypothetical protein